MLLEHGASKSVVKSEEGFIWEKLPKMQLKHICYVVLTLHFTIFASRSINF